MTQKRTPEEFGIPEYSGTYLEFLGFHIIDARPGYARLQMALDKAHTNTMGMAHGGVVMSMLDIAGAFSAHAGDAGDEVSITMTQSTSFIKPVTGAVLVAEGEVVRRVGRTAFTRSTVLDPGYGDDRQAQICATAQCTFRVKQRPRSGE